MPIVDFTRNAQRKKENILTSPRVSPQNRDLFLRFLDIYDVSAARQSIFFDKIKPFLESCLDVAAVKEDRTFFNRYFRVLRESYAPATYWTHFTVVRRFMRWVCGGDEPKCLADLKMPPKKKLRRSLDPEDMVTWEDGRKLAHASGNIQLAAIILTQLDAGLRPSEFIDLRFGDVKRIDSLLSIKVRSGKTGDRLVVLHRSVPFLSRWLDEHPTKDARDPLWISEVRLRRGVTHGAKLVPYPYYALMKRIRVLGARAGIKKPLDFYCFRHSSCVLDRMDNLPVDLAAERHGHSVKFFTEVYGRLSPEDIAKRFTNHYGIASDEEENKPKVVRCNRCGHINDAHSSSCHRCAAPLSIQAAMTIHRQAVQLPMPARAERHVDELQDLRDREWALQKKLTVFESERERSQKTEEFLTEQNRILKEELAFLRSRIAGTLQPLGNS